MTTATKPTFVVGVDGSEGSRIALQWAVAMAAALGGTVTAVTAWHYPPLPAAPGLSPITYDEENYERAAVSAARLVLDELPTDGPVPIDHQVVNGDARRVLIDASRDAAALVVGSRGHGILVGALLGSVSLGCVEHASCPVVVIPKDWSATPPVDVPKSGTEG